MTLVWVVGPVLMMTTPTVPSPMLRFTTFVTISSSAFVVVSVMMPFLLYILYDLFRAVGRFIVSENLTPQN